jgi:hypothetical protein
MAPTNADVERWVERGIITAAQRDAILQDLSSRGPLAGGLNLTTLLYYGGGLLVLIAYSIFLGLQWGTLNETARIVIAAASLVLIGAVAQVLLRDERYRLPGELLQVVAVAIIPLLVFALLDSAGVWPQDPGQRYPYRASEALRRQYEIDLTWARMGLAGATMGGALIAFRLSRSPFVLIAVIVSVTSLLVDASIQVESPRLVYTWGTSQELTVAAMGVAAFAAGVAARGRTERDYSLWLYITGVAGLAVGLGAKVLPDNVDDSAVWGALWMIAALSVLGLSIPLQQRILAAAGLVGVFVYLAKLVFQVFESASAALVMALLGLAVLGAGMLYQRLTGRMATPPA